ncbi:MAG TPA: hypothetical protein VFV50_01495 [Bdellovibrionales bacterium]|nr:hypothetical protein [Bdellovibrionales bacterium]
MKSSNALLCLSLLTTLACSGGGGGGNSQPKPSYLGEATKPGYLPDGTQVQALTPEQVKELTKSIGATAAIGAGFTKASGVQTSFGGSESAAAGDLSVGADKALTAEVTENLKSKCTVSKTETKPQISGSSSSGSLYGSARASTTGYDCPLKSSLQADTSGSYSKSNSHLAINMTVKMQNDYEIVGAGLSEKTGLTRGSSNLNVSVALNANDRNQATIEATGNTSGLWQFSNGTELKEKHLFEMSFASQSSSNTSGVIRMALVYDFPSFKALIQVFGTMNNGTLNAKTYINGESADSNFGLGIANSNPAFQSVLQQLAIQH